jgi:hypothetical protein
MNRIKSYALLTLVAIFLVLCYWVVHGFVTMLLTGEPVNDAIAYIIGASLYVLLALLTLASILIGKEE